MDLNLHPALAHIENEITVWKPDLQLHRIARLVVQNRQSFVPNLPAGSGHSRLNRLLIPGFDGDIGIRGFDPKLRFAAQGEGLRPLIGPERRNRNQKQSHHGQRKTPHSEILQLRAHFRPAVSDVGTHHT
jgi:hypothetical protein